MTLTFHNESHFPDPQLSSHSDTEISTSFLNFPREGAQQQMIDYQNQLLQLLLSKISIKIAFNLFSMPTPTGRFNITGIIIFFRTLILFV